MTRLEVERSRSYQNVRGNTELYKLRLKQRLEKIKQDVIATNEMVIKRRNIYDKKVVDNLKAKTEQISLRHQEVANRISKEAIGREVNLRVNRGLESLEELISLIRLSNWSESDIQEAIHDPAISSTQNERARRITISKFIKSIQRELIEQTEFINIAAHELRTPIMPILANAEILEHKLGGSEEVRAIVRNALRLQRLAQNILDVARINAGSLPLKKMRFNLNDLIDEIIDDESSHLPNANVTLEIAGNQGIEIFADRDRISQVLLNLLGNAIKYTEKGLITVAIEEQEGHVIVTVTDSGPGIDPMLFPVLFSRFGKNSYTGTGIGLGLYISRSIVEAHGGIISAKNNSPPERGAVFSFVLPRM